MESITSKDGTTIAFDRLGHGPPVVLACGRRLAERRGPFPLLDGLGREVDPTVLTRGLTDFFAA